MIGTDKQWQEIINKFGIDKAGEYLLYLLNSKRFNGESLEQPSPNISVPTITTNNTVESTSLNGNI